MTHVYLARKTGRAQLFPYLLVGAIGGTITNSSATAQRPWAQWIQLGDPPLLLLFSNWRTWTYKDGACLFISKRNAHVWGWSRDVSVIRGNGFGVYRKPKPLSFPKNPPSEVISKICGSCLRLRLRLLFSCKWYSATAEIFLRMHRFAWPCKVPLILSSF